MSAKVAVVPIQDHHEDAFRRAVDLIGGLAGLNTPERDVTIKVGFFDPRMHHHTTLEVLQAIVSAFDLAPHIYIAESDNYCGKALDRLERFQPIFSERVVPFSLSDDLQAKRVTIAGEEMSLASVLFKPNVLISTHVLRSFAMGSVLKNLFGCTPMVKKSKYHQTGLFSTLLADIYEAAGGIDLAIMDATYLYHGASDRKVPLNLILAGRDAVAVEAVGATLAGLKPEKIRSMQEFIRRGLGESRLDHIEIVGVSEEEFGQYKRASKQLAAMVKAEPRSPGISGTLDRLIEEGWLDTYRCVPEVVEELKQRGVANAKQAVVHGTLKRRIGKSLERAKEGNEWAYRRKAG